MPGERFTKEVVDFLLMEEEFDRLFPGFETEIHGVVHNENGEYPLSLLLSSSFLFILYIYI